MPLVEMKQAGLEAHRPQRPHPADSQQHVLGKPRVRVGVVQARGDPTLDGVVLRTVGVEQEQRYATHVDAPDSRRDLGVRLGPDRQGTARRR